MKNILITENQLRLITEALGVPDNILNTAKEVFDMVAVNLRYFCNLRQRKPIS